MSTNTPTTPAMIESLDFETILAEHVKYARENIDGWTAELESDPVLKLLQNAAYRELLLRQRINNAAASNLVSHATGSDLDAIGGWYQSPRLTDEPDARYRTRLMAWIASLAGNGTHDYYVSRAMAAHLSVIDVVAYRLSPGLVNVAVWTTEEQADAALSAVRARLASDATTMLGIKVNVFAATVATFDVSATVRVDASAPTNVAELIAAQIRARAERERGFGDGVATSQIVDWIHDVKSVDKVTLTAPTTDLAVAKDALWQVGQVTIEVIYD